MIQARRACPTATNLCTFLCMGFNELISKEKAEAMGLRAFSMKPPVMWDLAEKIRKMLASGQVMKNFQFDKIYIRLYYL